MDHLELSRARFTSYTDTCGADVDQMWLYSVDTVNTCIQSYVPFRNNKSNVKTLRISRNILYLKQKVIPGKQN